jgi:acyl-coenzyme A thioesterase PaaI-like protein
MRTLANARRKIALSRRFGGSATKLETEASNYHSEPNQIASRIQALHGMVHAILRVMRLPCDAMLPLSVPMTTKTKTVVPNYRHQQRHGIYHRSGSTQCHGGSDRGRFSAAGMETAASVGTTSRFVAHWVESTQTVRVARFAESYVGRRVGLEAKSLHSTIQDIRQEIREKAESLRKVSGISDAANDGTC